jgi:hypothetical protein
MMRLYVCVPGAEVGVAVAAVDVEVENDAWLFKKPLLELTVEPNESLHISRREPSPQYS